LNYLELEAKAKKIQFKKEDWTLKQYTVRDRKVPQQRNSFDCGIFVCMYADFLLVDLPFRFSQDDMDFFRLRLCAEIIRGYS